MAHTHANTVVINVIVMQASIHRDEEGLDYVP